ncbi:MULTISPECIES: NUDIX domain-containing protein [unclassified Streptomyces]|uniref:NUDIX hydrolase n=1 Tax=unclassified Streptomyces TaxID=2593676 RepID=UPI0037945C5E
MLIRPSLWPVSVKGIALDRTSRVLLLRNERAEWELPGGRMEIGPPASSDPGDPSPEATVERELREETGWEVRADALIDTWIYEPVPERRVLIITYDCIVLTPDQKPVVSNEHSRIGLFSPSEVAGLTMPAGYKRSIAADYAARARRERGIRGQP